MTIGGAVESRIASFLVTIAVQIVAAALLAGIGSLLQPRARETTGDVRVLVYQFWIGLAAVVAGLQVWSFFGGVDAWALGIFVALAAVGLARSAPSAIRGLLGWAPAHVWPLLSIAAAGVWFAGIGQLSLRHGDTGLYHMQSVRWIREYAAVPGLGNLHVRLAFNNSFHLLAALLESAGLPLNTGPTLNGLLGTATLATLAPSLRALPGKSTARVLRVFDGLLIVPALAAALSRPFFGLSPDPAILFLGLVVGSFLLHHLVGPADDEASLRFCLIALLAGLGLTMKLSFTPLALLTPLTAMSLGPSLGPPRRLGAALLGWSSLVVPWCARNVILSGHLIFPVPITRLPVDWAVPRSLSLATNNITMAWARRPGTFWTHVGNFDWIPHWIASLTPELALVGATSLLFWPATMRVTEAAIADSKRPLYAVGAVFGVALLFWFLTAPGARFVGAIPWVLAAAAASILATESRTTVARRIVIGISLTVFTIPLPLGLGRAWAAHRQRIPPSVAVERRSTSAGITVFVPTDGDACWDTEIPCTPNFRASLTPLGDDLGDGFRLPPDPVYAHVRDPFPPGFRCSPGIGVAFRPATGWSSYDEEDDSRTIRRRAELLVFSTRTVRA